MLLNYCLGSGKQESRYYTNTASAELLPFTLVSCGLFDCGSDYFTEREGHGQCLFMATLSGCGRLKYGDVECLIPAGRAVAIDCRRYQYYAAHGDENWRFVWIHFRGDSALRFCTLLNGNGLRLGACEGSRAEETYAELKALAEEPGRSVEFRISLLLHTLLNRLAEDEGGVSTRCRAEIEAAAAHIRREYAAPLCLDGLARESNLSKYHFIRQFRRFIGQTPYEFMTGCRINEAKKLLLQSEQSVAEVAAAVGFGDAKGFITSFKKRTGTTPLQFRMHGIF